MNIGILGGTGDLGRALALRWVAAGHDVVIGSRSAERAEEAAGQLRSTLEAARPERPGSLAGTTNLGACERADLLVLAVPARPDEDFFVPLVASLRGKVLLDCTVDLDPGDPTRVASGQPATAVRIQEHVGPEVTVVAAFHTLAAGKLLDLDRDVTADTFIVGDDANAKATVTALAEEIGLRCFDAGPLDAGRTLERMTAMLIGMNKRYRRRGLGFSLSGY